MDTVYPYVCGYTVSKHDECRRDSHDRTTDRPDRDHRRQPSQRETVPTSIHRDWQRISLFVGGIMFAVGNMLHPLEHKDAAYESATWEAAHLTIFFSLPLLVLGLPYLHRRLADTHRLAARHLRRGRVDGRAHRHRTRDHHRDVRRADDRARSDDGTRIGRHGGGQRTPRRRLPRRHDRPRVGRQAMPSCARGGPGRP